MPGICENPSSLPGVTKIIKYWNRLHPFAVNGVPVVSPLDSRSNSLTRPITAPDSCFMRELVTGFQSPTLLPTYSVVLLSLTLTSLRYLTQPPLLTSPCHHPLHALPFSIRLPHSRTFLLSSPSPGHRRFRIHEDLFIRRPEFSADSVIPAQSAPSTSVHIQIRALQGRPTAYRSHLPPSTGSV